MATTVCTTTSGRLWHQFATAGEYLAEVREMPDAYKAMVTSRQSLRKISAVLRNASVRRPLAWGTNIKPHDAENFSHKFSIGKASPNLTSLFIYVAGVERAEPCYEKRCNIYAKCVSPLPEWKNHGIACGCAGCWVSGNHTRCGVSARLKLRIFECPDCRQPHGLPLKVKKAYLAEKAAAAAAAAANAAPPSEAQNTQEDTTMFVVDTEGHEQLPLALPMPAETQGKKRKARGTKTKSADKKVKRSNAADPGDHPAPQVQQKGLAPPPEPVFASALNVQDALEFAAPFAPMDPTDSNIQFPTQMQDYPNGGGSYPPPPAPPSDSDAHNVFPYYSAQVGLGYDASAVHYNEHFPSSTGHMTIDNFDFSIGHGGLQDVSGDGRFDNGSLEGTVDPSFFQLTSGNGDQEHDEQHGAQPGGMEFK